MFILDRYIEGKNMVKEFIIIKMEINMRGNGKRDNNKDMVYIDISKEIYMKANGKMVKKKEKELFNITMGIDMKVSLV